MTEPTILRTRAQRFADDFDRRLFALINSAENYAEMPDSKSQAIWEHVLGKLRLSRHVVRSLMHPDDRKATK